MNKYKDIFTKWIADELIKKGHLPLKTRANSKNQKYDVYVFRNTVQFDLDMTEIISR